MARAIGPSSLLSSLTASLGFQSPATDSRVVLGHEPGGSGIVPPGCSSGGFKGRFVGLDSREEALQACMQWALACKALFEGQGGWPRMLHAGMVLRVVQLATSPV